jgi:hypothetical protein
LLFEVGNKAGTVVVVDCDVTVLDLLTLYLDSQTIHAETHSRAAE